MKEDYASYELAKKLKACGFDEQKERIIAKPYTIGGITLYHGDCLDVLPTLANGSISACIADLPYGCLNKSNKHAQWDNEIDLDALWAQLLRVCKPNAAIVLFGQGMFSAKLMMSQPKLWRYNLVWDKCRATGFLNANKMPLRYHEDILVFYRSLPTYNPQMEDLNGRERNHPQGYGKHREYNRCYGNIKRITPQLYEKKHPRSIIKIAREHGSKQDAFHPTQKPVALLEYLIRTYTNEGDCVLDCTMGSGSTMVACANTNRKGVGIELMEEYYNIAVERVKVATAQPKLDL